MIFYYNSFYGGSTYKKQEIFTFFFLMSSGFVLFYLFIHLFVLFFLIYLKLKNTESSSRTLRQLVWMS